MSSFEYDRNHLLGRLCASTLCVVAGLGPHKCVGRCSKWVSVSNKSRPSNVLCQEWQCRLSSVESNMVRSVDFESRVSDSTAEVPRMKRNTFWASRLTAMPLAQVKQTRYVQALSPSILMFAFAGCSEDWMCQQLHAR